VRRAAANLVAVVVASYADLLNELYPRVAPALISRFSEREENVREDVFRVRETDRRP
jgi:cullin-associated NEDD8-dissociated protein 1